MNTYNYVIRTHTEIPTSCIALSTKNSTSKFIE
jgi:hypothetical protein